MKIAQAKWFVLTVVTVALTSHTYAQTTSVSGSGPDVVVVEQSVRSGDVLDKVKLACDFYGLTYETVQSGTLSDYLAGLPESRLPSIILPASDLVGVDLEAAVSTASAATGTTSILLLDVDADSVGSQLVHLGLPAVQSERLEIDSDPNAFVFPSDPALFELAGTRLTLAASDPWTMRLSEEDGWEVLCAIVPPGENGSRQNAVFARALKQGAALYVASKQANEEDGPWEYSADKFAELMPILVFLRNSRSDRVWNHPDPVANLIVDDPFLIDPFGSFSYAALLPELKSVGFHVTVAQIPYYYRYADPEVVSILRTNSKYFSLAIHGNNHDGMEFPEYTERPLTDQIDDLEQGLARSRVLASRTGIPIDPILVFPHGIGPADTVAALRRTGYIATFNGTFTTNGNADTSPRASVALRGLTLSQGDVPSYLRHSFGRSYTYDGKVDLSRTATRAAIDAYLGAPLVFYTHQDFFAHGSDAFNEAARVVNTVVPNVTWVPLSAIVGRTYVYRELPDGRVQAAAFTDYVRFTNPVDRAVTVRLEREYAGQSTLASRVVTPDDVSVEFEVHDTTAVASFQLDRGQTVELTFEPDAPPLVWDGPLDNASLSVRMARMASEARDLAISRFELGRRFASLYYGDRPLALAVFGVAAVAAGFVMSLIPFVWFYTRRRRHLTV